jgi:hypothetical protein
MAVTTGNTIRETLVIIGSGPAGWSAGRRLVQDVSASVETRVRALKQRAASAQGQRP